jgi:hypothetical protein
MKPVALTADLLEAFAGTFLSPRYDNPVPTPPFHREGWALYCSAAPQAVLVAPRDHAKSTAFTFAFILAEVCFRVSDYVILISSTEENAAEQLSNIREELLDNEDLRREFGIRELEKDSTTDIIVRCDDGFRFRVLARGSEQKIRGKLWKGKRPNLMVCDDMEDDEQVESSDRRKKFRRWFFRAARQALSRTGRLRVHGTILHEDSLLARLRKNKTWKSLFYKAHAEFDDFSHRLWPEAWSEDRLRKRRQEFIEDGDSGGYSSEFLNDPQDNDNPYLRRQDFLPMTQEDRERPKMIGAAADFAVSKSDLANRTSFTVGGRCTRNLLHIIDQRVGRWASIEVLESGEEAGWIPEMFSIQERWHPEFFWVEDGAIWKSIKHLVYDEMRKRDIWLNLVEIPSVKDKAVRGRTLQKRMRAGACRFDKDTDWYPEYEQELLRFTGGAQARLDDQFDSTSLLAIGFDRFTDLVEDDDFLEEEELSIRELNRLRRPPADGRNAITGY